MDYTIVGTISIQITIVRIHPGYNFLKMKGGRMYEKILEFLISQDDVNICKGIDVMKILKMLDLVKKFV